MSMPFISSFDALVSLSDTDLGVSSELISSNLLDRPPTSRQHMLSKRGADISDVFPSYFSTVRAKSKDRWLPTRPTTEGYVGLCIAENHLTQDVLAAKLQETRIPAEYISGYPPANGLPKLNEALAQYLTRTFLKGLAVNPSNLTTLAGCGAVLDLLFFAIANSGQRVLIPAPYYPAFDSDLTIRNGLHPTPLFLDKGADLVAQLEAAYEAAELAGQPVAALILTNPNNPDGVLIPREDLETYLAWCCERQVHLVSDEIYANSVFEPERFHSMLTVATEHPSGNMRRAAKELVHLVFGASKDWCANGLRMGCVHTENAALLSALDGMAYFAGVSSIAQEAITSVLEDTRFMDNFLATNRERLYEAYTLITGALDELHIPYSKADGAIFVWVDLSAALPEPTWEAEAAFWLRLVEEARVVITPGKSCHAKAPGFFRVCYAAAPLAGLAEGVSRLKAFLLKLKKEKTGTGRQLNGLAAA